MIRDSLCENKEAMQNIVPARSNAGGEPMRYTYAAINGIETSRPIRRPNIGVNTLESNPMSTPTCMPESAKI